MQRSASSFATVVPLLFAAACGGGGGGGGGGGTQPPIDSAAVPASIGFSSAAAGSGVARVAWTALDSAGQPVDIAVFVATDENSVYAGAPVHVGSGSGQATVAGLADGTDAYFGLALDEGGGVFSPIGELAHVVPGAPIFVDANSSAAAPDGLTPGTAFRDPIDGVLAAFAQGGGNVWVAEGAYANVALVLWPGVRLMGGFDSSFALAARDPQTNRTILQGRAGAAVVEVTLGGSGATLDGVEIDGSSLAPFGVDVDQTDTEIRGVVVERCAGRGMRLRSASLTSATHVSLSQCKVSSNGAEGVSVDGAFKLVVEGSRFASNAFEGFDCDALVAPDNVAVGLDVRDSVFAANGQEGLDCDLAAPLSPGPGPGRFSIEISGSVFEGNGRGNLASGSAGLNLDVDFELVSGWRADMVVRGCTARANRGNGIQLDLDSTASAFLHRVHSSSNGGDGLRVSSESTPGFATVSGSSFVGNGGFGVEAVLGQVPVLLGHSIVSGNALGGVASSVVTSAAVSSVAWRQSTPWTNVLAHFDVEANDLLQPPFVRAPFEFYSASSFDGSSLALASALGLAIGDHVELGDDGVLRTVSALLAGDRVQLAPPPADSWLPAGLARFDGAGSAIEDFRLSPTSPGSAAGMPVAGGALDAGPFGAPLAGDPGREDAPRATLFFASESTPVPGRAIAATQSIRIDFRGGVLDALTASSLTVKVRNAAGAPVAAAVSVQANGLVVAPSSGTWPSGGLAVELHPGLASLAGDGLAAPLALPFSVP